MRGVCESEYPVCLAQPQNPMGSGILNFCLDSITIFAEPRARGLAMSALNYWQLVSAVFANEMVQCAGKTFFVYIFAPYSFAPLFGEFLALLQIGEQSRRYRRSLCRNKKLFEKLEWAV